MEATSLKAAVGTWNRAIQQYHGADTLASRADTSAWQLGWEVDTLATTFDKSIANLDPELGAALVAKSSVTSRGSAAGWSSIRSAVASARTGVDALATHPNADARVSRDLRNVLTRLEETVDQGHAHMVTRDEQLELRAQHAQSWSSALTEVVAGAKPSLDEIARLRRVGDDAGAAALRESIADTLELTPSMVDEMVDIVIAHVSSTISSAT